MKHTFFFRQRPSELLTPSSRGFNGGRTGVERTVKGRSNDCRMTLDRVSTLFLLLIALSFGFNQQVKAWNFGACKVYFDNSQWKWNDVKVHIWNGNGNYSDWTFTKVAGSDYWEYNSSGWNDFSAFKFYTGNYTNQSNELTTELNSDWITRCFSGDGNQNWTLVGPKNVGLSNTTTVLGGAGTQSDPYVVLPGTKITVSASGDKIDDATTVNFKFNSGSYGTSYTYTVVSSASTGQTYNVKATVKTVRDSYNSREFTTTTIYYKTANFKLVGDYCSWDFYNAQAFDANNEVTITSLTGNTSNEYTNGFKVVYGDSWDNAYGAYTNPYELKPCSSAYGLLKGDDSKNFTSPVDYTNAKFKLEWKDKEGTPTLHLTFVSATYPTYAVTLNADGGTINADNITQYTYATGATLPTDVTKTGYTFAGWFLNNAGSRVYSISTTDIGAKSYTAHWTEQKHTAAIAYMCGSTAIKSAGTSGSAGIATTTSITAPDITGYIFQSWGLPTGATTSDQLSSKTINVNLTADDLTITANYEKDVTMFSYAFGRVNGMTDAMGIVSSSPNDASLESGTEITITATPETGYQVEGWYSDQTGNTPIVAAGTETTYTFQIAANTSVYVKFEYIDYTITMKTTDGGTITAPIAVAANSQEDYTTAHYQVPFAIVAEAKEGYTFDKWTATENILIGEVASINGANVMPRKLANDAELESTAGAETVATLTDVEGEKTITANFTENLAALTASVNANSTGMGTVKLDGRDVLTKQIGVTTTATLTATSANRNYKFKQWTLTNCTITSGNANKETITVKGDGTNAATAVAEFEVAWYVCGADKDVFGGWGSNGHKLTKMDGVDKFTYTINVQKIATGDTDFEFKVYNFNQNKYYDYENFWFTRENYYSTLYTHETQTKNMKLRSDMVGDYTFTLDCSTSRETPVLTVTFPGETSVNVQVAADGKNFQNVEVGSVSHPTITAVVPAGYRFDKWVVTGTAALANENAASTQITSATEGAKIQATFTTEGVIYFDKTSCSSWYGDKVYVYFFSDEVWYNDPREGGYGPGVVPDHDYTGNWLADGEMTRIGQTNLYYYIPDQSKLSQMQRIAFASKGYSEVQKGFYMCSGVYLNKRDFKSGSVYMVSSGIEKDVNNVQYFNYGFWRPYNSTDSKYVLWYQDGGSKTAEFTNEDASTNYTVTLDLAANTTYEFKIKPAEYDDWFGNNGTMTSTNCEGWSMTRGTENCKITTTSAGKYTFTLALGMEPMKVSVEYPLSIGDYRLAYEEYGSPELQYLHPNHFVKKVDSGIAKDTLSFGINKDKNTYSKYIYLQEVTAISDNEITWENVSGKYLTIAEDATITEGGNGVYNFVLEQNNGTPTITCIGKYEGPYYIRTDCAAGKWGMYKTSANEMTQSDVLKRNMAGKGDYNYYFAQWATAGTNVKYCVANNYSEALTDSLKADTYTTVAGHDEAANQTLPKDASVRFMYNNTTNTLKRAYLNGSTDDIDRYLMLIGDNSASGGKYIYDISGETPARFTNDEVKLEDKGNWTYQIDIQADVTARGKLVATYNGQEQYFKGSEGEFAKGTTEQIIGGDATSDTKYGVRIVYDFKTNNMVAGWMPSNTNMPIEEQMAIYADVIIIRNAQEHASQISFSGSGELTEVKTVYGAIEFSKEEMVGKMNSWDDNTYKHCMYYISFPFDVKVSEIFGLGTYGDTWLLQYYDGAERASKGWFAETKTFWKDVDFNATLKANVGYSFLIDRPTFNDGGSSIWKNSIGENARVYVYFPSIKEVSGIQQAESLTVTVPEHECKINREFTINEGKDNERTLNHTFTDSHWNMMGVPVFQDVDGGTYSEIFLATDENTTKFNYLYAWDYSNNTLHIQNVNDGTFKFKAMHSYMVQYAGTITWTGSTVTPAAIAARQIGEKKDYTVDLQLNYNNARVARTYVELREGANADFMLNEDVYMMTNSAAGNIYSLAGSYDVAANVLPEKSQIVPLGVIANKSGEFTFTMPSNFSGTVTLVDKVANTETDLQLQDYTVTLNKGTYEGRFELKLNIERTIGTDFNGADYQGGKPEQFKFIRDNRLHILLPNGRIFNALGGRTK